MEIKLDVITVALILCVNIEYEGVNKSNNNRAASDIY